MKEKNLLDITVHMYNKFVKIFSGEICPGTHGRGRGHGRLTGTGTHGRGRGHGQIQTFFNIFSIQHFFPDLSYRI